MERRTWGGREDAEIVQLGEMAQQLRGPEGSGLNKHIRAAMCQNEDYGAKLEEVCNEIDTMAFLQHWNLQVAVNCKWGKHRSVSFGEDLGAKLVGRGHTVAIFHLEQPRWDHATRDQLPFGGQDGFTYPFAQAEQRALLGARRGHLGQGVVPMMLDAPRGIGPVWYRVS